MFRANSSEKYLWICEVKIKTGSIKKILLNLQALKSVSHSFLIFYLQKQTKIIFCCFFMVETYDYMHKTTAQLRKNCKNLIKIRLDFAEWNERKIMQHSIQYVAKFKAIDNHFRRKSKFLNICNCYSSHYNTQM